MRRKIPNLQYTRKCEEKEYNDEKCNTEDCPQDANAAKYMSVFKNPILRNTFKKRFVYLHYLRIEFDKIHCRF